MYLLVKLLGLGCRVCTGWVLQGDLDAHACLLSHVTIFKLAQMQLNTKHASLWHADAGLAEQLGWWCTGFVWPPG
jgi:hypothetical protein